MGSSERLIRRAGTRRLPRRWIAVPAALAAVVAMTSPGQATNRSVDTAAAPMRPGDGRDDVEPAEVSPVEHLDRGPKLTTMLATGDEPQTFLIRLADAPVPSYEGGTPGLAPTVPPAGEQLDPGSSPARAYRQHLVEEQVAFVDRMERTVGRAVDVPFTYQYAVNGLAAVLTPDEAREVALDPAVATIAPDQERQLHTDAGPQWSGAPALWNAVAELGLAEDVRGEGVVIGTIDTGIMPGNRSFADPAPGDGYDHTNPRGAGHTWASATRPTRRREAASTPTSPATTSSSAPTCSGWPIPTATARSTTTVMARTPRRRRAATW